MNLSDISRYFTRGNRVCTGVDTGTRRIKVVRVKKGEHGPVVISRASSPTPPGGLQDGGLARPEMVAALSRALQEAGVQEGGRDLVATIGGGRVITRSILMPLMPGAELEAAVKWEAERHIPLPVSQLIVRHVCLGEVEVEGTVQTHVLLAAVPRNLVHEYCALFREADRGLLAIDLQPLALWRVFFGLNRKEAVPGTVAVLDLGAASTELAVVRNGRLGYTRALPRGGNALTEALASGLGVDFATAELMKEAGEPGGLTEAAATGEAGPAFPFHHGTSELLREIRHSIEWYQSREYGHPVERVTVSGGGSKLRGLIDYLAGQLGLPVEVGRFPPVLEDAGADTDPAFAVAVGLALREVVY